MVAFSLVLRFYSCCCAVPSQYAAVATPLLAGPLMPFLSEISLVHVHLTGGRTKVSFMISSPYMIQAPPHHLPCWPCFLFSPHPSLWFNPPWTACFPSEYIRRDLTSGSLYQLSPWPGMFIPQMSMWFAPPHTSRLHSKFIFALTYSLHLNYQPLFPHNVFYPPPLLCFHI